MQKLRSLHLYLGCIFAPLLLFFALSGLWQTLGLHWPILARLSTIHTGHPLKNGHWLGSAVLGAFVVVMAVSFIVTTVLGVVMAVKFGRSRRAACACLAFGVVFPLLIILVKALS
jgi:ABC-type spermidine/putrescine transport system permease subunit II